MVTYLLLHLENTQWVFHTEGDGGAIRAALQASADKILTNWKLYRTGGQVMLVAKDPNRFEV